MNISKNGITIDIPDAEIVRMALERFNDSPQPDTLCGRAVPRIGEEWAGQGGIYAGIARGRDGTPDYHLIVGPESEGTGTWDAQQKWAAEQSIGGKKDYCLPFRKEQALCFANVPELFKAECYWSCEQHASYSGYAWGQGFLNGSQHGWLKDDGLRARLVRRLVIQ